MNLMKGVVKTWLEAQMSDILSFFWSAVLALVVFIIGRRIIRFITDSVLKGLEKKKVEKGVQTFTRPVLSGALYILLFVIILGLFGIEPSSIAATIVTMGVTVGFTLQGALSNFAGGVLILILHPFRVGDYIIEDTHKNEGEVIDISIFYTKLLTVDKKIVVIPNGVLANSSLTNYTKNPERMLDMTYSISYDSDVKKAKEILNELAEKDELRVNGRDILVFVRELNDSSVDIGVRYYVKTRNYWKARWDLNENVKERFDAEGIKIPFPQRDVHLYNDKS
ncbi:MAG: mechanosensitive ion channel family protein [Lachnospiraceae bacterium]|nr:mechanosensitive ion channel family protein [Lachnospiraceae bacterium]